jgi:eukaryotic-like serine/threonine-protein kinase
LPEPSPTAGAVRKELDLILASAVFANSERLRRFLRFLVERTLAGQTDNLKEYTIGLEVFDRDPSYDPRVDSTVRVHAGKLRDRLREYSLGQGKQSDVHIDIPKGTYIPVFTLRGTEPVRPARDRKPVLWRGVFVAALVALAFIAGAWWMSVRSQLQPATFHQITFRRGMISAARFTPDGTNIVYSAEFEGMPLDIFATRPEATDSRSLGMTGAHLLATGPAGAIAAATKSRYNGFFQFAGTLAKASLTGGVAREMLTDVVAADWSPDGTTLAVAKESAGLNRLESPPGKGLFDAPPNAWIGDVRFSPDGKRIAFLVHPLRGDNLGSLYVTDLAGKTAKLSGEWPGIQGVAWRPDGGEIWFAADEAAANSIYAVDLSGRKRRIWRGPDTMVLHDVSKNGRVLLGVDNVRLHVIAKPPGESGERDLSWLDAGCSCGFSRDGRTLLIGESGVGGGPRLSVYLRKTDGSAAVRLGDGVPLALSPDGTWVLAYRHDSPQRPVFLPTGAGEAKPVVSGDIRFLESGEWFPDGRQVLLVGRESNHPARSYTVRLADGAAVPLTPEGIRGVKISPDGKRVLVRDRTGQWSIFHVDDKTMSKVNGAEGVDLVDWSSTPDVVYARAGDIPAQLYRLNINTGKREAWRELKPADPAGAKSIQHIHVTAPGDAYAYTYFRFDARLFVVDGLK